MKESSTNYTKDTLKCILTGAPNTYNVDYILTFFFIGGGDGVA